MKWIKAEIVENTTSETWLTEEGYRIVWRDEVFGIKVSPIYNASVCMAGERPNWDLLISSKNMKKCKTACEKHFELWSRAKLAKTPRELKEILGKAPVGVPLFAIEVEGIAKKALKPARRK